MASGIVRLRNQEPKKIMPPTNRICRGNIGTPPEPQKTSELRIPIPLIATNSQISKRQAKIKIVNLSVLDFLQMIIFSALDFLYMVSFSYLTDEFLGSSIKQRINCKEKRQMYISTGSNLIWCARNRPGFSRGSNR